MSLEAEQILEFLHRLDSKLDGIAGRISSLEGWRTATETTSGRFFNQTWPRAEQLHDALADRMRLVEREQLAIEKIHDIDSRLKDVEKTAVRLSALAAVVGAVIGALIPLVARLVHL